MAVVNESLSSVPKSLHVAVVVGGFSDEANFGSAPWVIASLRRQGLRVSMHDVRETSFVGRLRAAHPDIIFPTCLGAYGEDGKLQGFLETMFPDTPYVGSGVNASAIGMNKLHTKLLCQGLGIDTARYVFQPKGKRLSFARAVARLGTPVVVKPLLSGASLGLTITDDPLVFQKSITEGGEVFGDLLIEACIQPKEPYVEYAAGVLDGDNGLIVLPVCEIRADGIYDTGRKSGHAVYRIPAPLEPELTQKMQAVAKQLHLMAGCHGLSRVDLMADRDGRVCVLELNTLPGLIPSMTFARMAAAHGLDFDDLIALLLRSAQRARRMEIPRRPSGTAPPLPASFRPMLPKLPKKFQPKGMYAD